MGLKKLDSEYNSHFKTLPVHRPVTIKAKLLSHPSDSAPEALESSRRAGLLSNQFSQISEPALQRKKIVPYKHNHNIFPTSTVKELDDGEWLDAVGSDIDSSRSACSKKERHNMVQSKKEQTEYNSHYPNKPRVEKESPIMLAKKTRTRKTSKNHYSQVNNNSVKTPEHSPERLPPAGIPTFISDPHDKRLLRPSDGSDYLTFPDEHPRNTETEYSERYYSAALRNEEKHPSSKNKESGSNINDATYKKVLLHRNVAYGLPTATTTPLSTVKKLSPANGNGSVVRDRPTKTVKQNTKKEKYTKREESPSSFRSTDHCKETRDKRQNEETVTKQIRREAERTRRRSLESENASSPRSSSRLERTKPLESERGRYALERSTLNVDNVKKLDKTTKRRSRRRAWQENYNPSMNENVRSSRGRKGSRGDVVERGRSPTPEMLNVGQSRRHHLDVTTGNNNPLASNEERYKTRILTKVSKTQVKPRVSYDPSRYSDAGDDLSARSISASTDRDTIDSRR